jgi:hypothetical protein
MKDDVSRLAGLHDIVEPPPVPWWPPAPEWYVLVSIGACLLAWVALRRWRRWRSEAYRRSALRELESANTAVAVAEVLRRTALSILPRAAIASLTGTEWAARLEKTSPDDLPNQVRSQLAGGVYREPGAAADVTALRDYAACWIRHHRLPETLDA